MSKSILSNGCNYTSQGKYQCQENFSNSIIEKFTSCDENGGLNETNFRGFNGAKCDTYGPNGINNQYCHGDEADYHGMSNGCTRTENNTAGAICSQCETGSKDSGVVVDTSDFIDVSSVDVGGNIDNIGYGEENNNCEETCLKAFNHCNNGCNNDGENQIPLQQLQKLPQLNNTCFVDKNNFIKYSGYLNKNDSANETKLFNQFLCREKREMKKRDEREEEEDEERKRREREKKKEENMKEKERI